MNSRRSDIDCSSRWLSAQRVKRDFCSSLRVLRSFSSLRLSRWRAVLYSGQGEQSYSDGSILPYQNSYKTLAHSIFCTSFFQKMFVTPRFQMV